MSFRSCRADLADTEVISKVRRQVIDLPPVLSPDDTLVVAPRIDALILVASEGVTPREDLQKASEMLADFPVAGLVLNRSTDGSQRYGYGYGYGGGNNSG